MTSILRPGLLVSAKTSMSGGVEYQRQELGTADVQTPSEAAAVARWETTRIIEDPEEHARAGQVRSKCMTAIRRVCAQTSFGLLCPIGMEFALDEAIKEARDLASEFNETAQHARIGVYILKGRIADNDDQATRAIASEVRGLLEEMQNGIRAVDASAIRAAANKAREVGKILDQAQADQVGRAIKAARSAAREIVKRVEKGGEDAELVYADLRTGAVDRARFAFLDIENNTNNCPGCGADPCASDCPLAQRMPATDVQRAASIDLSGGDNQPPMSAAPMTSRSLDLI